MPVILVVDDNLDNVVLLERFLLHLNFAVVRATSGEAALAAVRHPGDGCAPDLVLCDIQMPGMDGLEFTRQIKGAAATQALPVLLVSGHITPEDREAAEAAGADALVAKPVDYETLRYHLRGWLPDARL